MIKQKLHSKLLDLQGQIISKSEKDLFFVQLLKVLDLRSHGQISIAEAGARIRKSAWKIAEDLRLDGFALSSGTDQSLVDELPGLLKLRS